MIMHPKAAAWLDGIFDEASWYMHKELKKFMGLLGYWKVDGRVEKERDDLNGTLLLGERNNTYAPPNSF